MILPSSSTGKNYFPYIRNQGLSSGFGYAIASQIDPNTALADRVPSTNLLTIPTGFTGNDIVEPQMLYDPDGTIWGHKYLLQAAPYYQSNAALENPSIWVSDDGNTWSVPAGVTNPIYASGVGGGGQNSDGSILLGVDGRLYITFNQFSSQAGHWWIRAGSASPSDLTTWSSPVTVVDTVTASSRPTSPSGFYDPVLKLYVFYTLEIAAGNPYTLQRWTTPVPTSSWTQSTAPTGFTIANEASRTPWHLNAYLIGDQHVILMNDTNSGGNSGGRLYMAVSNDRGATWTMSDHPILWNTGSTNWDSKIYRSCMIPCWDRGRFAMDLFYFGNDTSNGWQAARTKIRFTRAEEGSRVNNRITPNMSLYYTTPGAVSTQTLSSDGTGAMRAAPFYVDKKITLDRIGVEITALSTDAAAVVRPGIYIDWNGVPYGLVLDAGTINASTTGGATGWNELTINLTLNPGVYWLVCAQQGITSSYPTFRSTNGASNYGLPAIGSTTATTVSQNALNGYRGSAGSGALPALFYVWGTHPIAAAGIPRVMVRVS